MIPSKEGLQRFFCFVNERHSIYLRRASGESWPWTQDKILRKYKFCNIFRELDKVTVWIRENWREPYADHPNLWFAMAMARQINWPETLAEIGFPEKWHPRRVVHVIQHRRVQGLKAYTGAYMLTGTLGGEKAEQTAFKILGPLYRHPPPLDQASTLEDAFRMFEGRPGFGPFLSYEVVTDLRHTRYLRDATDTMTWANVGPGAVRGLHRVFGRPIKGRRRRDRPPLSQIDALAEMRYLLKVSPKYLGSHVPALEIRDVEHSCCEWDKYERTRKGEGVLERYKHEGSLGL